MMRQKVPTLRAYFHELLTPAVRALAWITLWGACMWLWVFTVFACIVQFDSLVSVDEQQKDGDSESTSGSAAVGMPSSDPIDTDQHDNADKAQPGVQQKEPCEAREGASRRGNRMVIGRRRRRDDSGDQVVSSTDTVDDGEQSPPRGVQQQTTRGARLVIGRRKSGGSSSVV